MVVDIEAYPDCEYSKLEFHSPRSRSRSPSPTRTPLRFRRLKFLYLRICLLAISFLFMFSTVDQNCTSRAAQGVIHYVVSIGETISESLPFSQTQSPFVQQSRYRPWELTDDEVVTEDITDEETSEDWLRNQEDEASIRRIQHVVDNGTVNNTVILIPVRSRSMVWVDNLSCRLSFMNLSNVLYWALDDSTATQLQKKGLRFYYNPLLDLQGEQENDIQEARHKVRILDWIVRAGFSVLYVEPTVVLFRDPMRSLVMDADVEIFADQLSLAKDAAVSESPHLGTGLFWLKSTDKASAFLNKIAARLAAEDHTNDIEAFNAALYQDFQAQPITDESNSENTTEVSESAFTFRTMSPLKFIKHPIFEKDMHLHRLGYGSAFSLRNSNWDNERFYPTLLYIHPRDLESYNIQRRYEGIKKWESRMVERWRSLGWWELDSKGRCAYLASKPDRVI